MKPAYTACKAPELIGGDRRQSQIDNLSAMRSSISKMTVYPAPDVETLRAQIALLSDDDSTALVVTEAARRGMLDDMRLAIMDAKAERMRG